MIYEYPIEVSMKSALFAVVLASQFSAYAYQFESVHYDRVSNEVSATLVFEGGEQEHNFTPMFDPCDKDTQPYGLAVRLEDSGWEDTGTKTMEQTVVFPIEDTSCLPAELTIFAGRAHHTIEIE